MSRQATAQQPAIWFDPPDNISQKSADFPKLFTLPSSWAESSRHLESIVITGNWLLQAPEAEVAQSTRVIRQKGIRVIVFLPSLPVNKRVCGGKTEGMIWPGEAALYATRLKQRHIDVYGFLLDLPLTNGHLSHKGDACNLSIADTARQLASSVHELQVSYPLAKIFDAEVPTGRPASEWLSALKLWLVEYRQAVGRELDGLIMDVWWEFPWIEITKDTANLLHARGISAGIYLDADGGATMHPNKWLADAHQNACAVLSQRLPIDVFVIANWTSTMVPNLPTPTQTSLTDFVSWFATGPTCKP